MAKIINTKFLVAKLNDQNYPVMEIQSQNAFNKRRFMIAETFTKLIPNPKLEIFSADMGVK
jgi:hypothetical protein